MIVSVKSIIGKKSVISEIPDSGKELETRYGNRNSMGGPLSFSIPKGESLIVNLSLYLDAIVEYTLDLEKVVASQL